MGVLRDWLLQIVERFWAETPVRLWLAFLAIGFVVEIFLKAERGQSFRQVFFNVRYSMIYLLMIFVVAPTLNMIVRGMAGIVGVGWINLDVLSSTDPLQQVAAAYLSVILLDFFLLLVSPRTASFSLTLGPAYGSPQ